MALISLRQLLDHAAENSYGLPAFNVNNMEQVQAIMQAAAAVDSPVILQGSAGARSYAGEPFLRHLIAAAIEMYPHIPVCMHQDHGATPGVCFRSIQSGFSSVMMDGSLLADGKTPASYEYNVNTTRQVVDLAHACGVSVEGELGCLGSLETGKKADLIALDLDEIGWSPLGGQDIYTALVYSVTGQHVRDMMVNGRWLFRDNRWLTVDFNAARRDLERQHTELMKRIKNQKHNL